MSQFGTIAVRALAALATAALTALPAAAQETDAAEGAEAAPAAASLDLELNATIATEAGCRLTFLVRNSLGADLDALSLEAVILTTDGAVERLTLFEFGAVPDARPRVRQFDLPGLDCPTVGQVLVNGVSACKGAGVEDGACLPALGLSSRIDAELIG